MAVRECPRFASIGLVSPPNRALSQRQACKPGDTFEPRTPRFRRSEAPVRQPRTSLCVTWDVESTRFTGRAGSSAASHEVSATGWPALARVAREDVTVRAGAGWPVPAARVPGGPRPRGQPASSSTASRRVPGPAIRGTAAAPLPVAAQTVARGSRRSSRGSVALLLGRLLSYGRLPAELHRGAFPSSLKATRCQRGRFWKVSITFSRRWRVRFCHSLCWCVP